MRRKVSVFVLCLVLISNAFGVMSLNLGEMSPNGMDGFEEFFPQDVEIPILSGNSGPGVSQWPIYQNDLKNSGYTEAEIVPPLYEKWIYTHPDRIFYPVIWNNVVYALSETELLAIDADTGTQRWSYPVYSAGTPAVSDGVVYVGSWDYNLYAFNADNGNFKWKYLTGGAVVSAPKVVNGIVYFGSDDGFLYALNTDGTLNWKYNSNYKGTIHSIRTSPAIADDLVYFTNGFQRDHTGQLYAIYSTGPNKGTAKWIQKPERSLRYTDPSVSDGMVFVGDQLYWDRPPYYSPANFSCFDAQTGSLIWQKTVRNEVTLSPAIAHGIIYYGTWWFDKRVYAYNMSSGSPLWSFALSGSAYNIAIASDILYVGEWDWSAGFNAKLHALDVNTGAQIWYHNIWGSVNGVSIAGDSVYVATEEGWLYCLSTEQPNQPPIANAGPDQTIFEGDIVYFSSSGSYDPDGTIVSYDWDFGDGSPHSNMENPRHIFNYAGNYTVTLIVTDDEGARGSDTCFINVLVVIKPPVADAGLDQTVYIGDTVYFDGSASYATVGAIKSMEWDFDSNVDSDHDGNTTNDVDGTGAYPTHIYNKVGVYEVTLCVTAKVETHETQKVNQDVVFVMDSSGSMNWNDPDDMRIQAAKNYVDKLNPDDRGAVVDFDTEATLIPDGWPIGDHLSTDYNKIKNNLDMVDSEGGTCISKGLNLSNEELRVHGYPENVHIIILLTDAQNTDPDDDELCINESKIALDRGIRIFTIGLTMYPNSTQEQLLIELANITGGMYFPAPNASSLEEIYEEISEIVENVTVQEMSDYDSCLITVLLPIQPPVANAGYEQTVYEGDTVYFDGSASYDPDGTIVSYEWDFGDGSHYGAGVNPTHIYNTPGNYTVSLTVTDDDGATDTDFCIIAVLPRKQPPIADAGYDQIANERDTVQFDGSGSYDPDALGGVWIFKTDNPSPTWGCAAAVLNGEIYYLGGIPCYPIVDPSSVFMKYDPYTDSWYALPDLPSPRAYLAAAAANNKIYAMGGREGNDTTDTVFEFDPTTNSWTAKSPMPVPLEAFGIATVKNRIYVIGGKSTWLSNNSLKSVYEYDPANDSWTAKPDMPSGRSNLACAVLEDKIYAIGGDAYGSTDAVEMYDPVIETWTVKASLLSARSGLCAETIHKKIYAFGGTGKWGLPTNATEMYDPNSDSWTIRPSMIEPRVYFGSGVVSNCIYAMGGSYGPLIVAIPNSTEEYCVGNELVYEWDFDASDGLWWETGAPPDATGPKPIHIYGDNGVYVVTLRVTDADNLSAIDTCNVTVQNVNPEISIKSAFMDVEIGLRVAGRKYNNVSMTLYEEGTKIGYVSIERLPGSPNEQMAWIPYILDMTKTYSATVIYEPVDPPYIGGNPVWIYVKFKNGSIQKIHHTFNVQQSKKRDSEHWNHIDPWEVDLNEELKGCPFEVKYHVSDPGSDDEFLTFSYGSQTKNVTHLNDPPHPDPFPSPEISPVDITDVTTLIYEGAGTIILTLEDDDGGTANTTFDLV